MTLSETTTALDEFRNPPAVRDLEAEYASIETSMTCELRRKVPGRICLSS